MSGIVLPQDRDIKQPAIGYCRNPACRESSGLEFWFRVEHDHYACPKCGETRYPIVGPLVLVHWLRPTVDGPITGRGGRRFALGCETRRAYLATASNLEAATDNAGLVTCEGCIRSALRAGGSPKAAAERNRHSILLNQG